MDKCGKRIDGYRIYGECTLEKNHVGPHSIPIDWFEWIDKDYCQMPGCDFLSYNNTLCEKHRG